MDWILSTFAAFEEHGKGLTPQETGQSGLTDAVLATFLASTTVHYMIFSLSIPEQFTAATRSRFASQFHALVAVAGVLLWFAQYSVNPWDPKQAQRMVHGGSAPGDALFPYFVSFSAGYFASDTIAMLANRDAFDTASLVHHLVIGPAFLLALHFRVLFPYQFFFLLEELSTIPLNYKWFSSGDAAAHARWSYAFAALFFAVRFPFGLWLFFSVFPVYRAVRHTLTAQQHALFIFEVVCSMLSRALYAYWLHLIGRKIMGKRKRGALKRD